MAPVASRQPETSAIQSSTANSGSDTSSSTKPATSSPLDQPAQGSPAGTSISIKLSGSKTPSPFLHPTSSATQTVSSVNANSLSTSVSLLSASSDKDSITISAPIGVVSKDNVISSSIEQSSLSASHSGPYPPTSIVLPPPTHTASRYASSTNTGEASTSPFMPSTVLPSVTISSSGLTSATASTEMLLPSDKSTRLMTASSSLITEQSTVVPNTTDGAVFGSPFSTSLSRSSPGASSPITSNLLGGTLPVTLTPNSTISSFSTAASPPVSSSSPSVATPTTDPTFFSSVTVASLPTASNALPLQSTLGPVESDLLPVLDPPSPVTSKTDPTILSSSALTSLPISPNPPSVATSTTVSSSAVASSPVSSSSPNVATPTTDPTFFSSVTVASLPTASNALPLQSTLGPVESDLLPVLDPPSPVTSKTNPTILSSSALASLPISSNPSSVDISTAKPTFSSSHTFTSLPVVSNPLPLQPIIGPVETILIPALNPPSVATSTTLSSSTVVSPPVSSSSPNVATPTTDPTFFSSVTVASLPVASNPQSVISGAKTNLFPSAVMPKESPTPSISFSQVTSFTETTSSLLPFPVDGDASPTRAQTSTPAASNIPSPKHGNNQNHDGATQVKHTRSSSSATSDQLSTPTPTPPISPSSRGPSAPDKSTVTPSDTDTSHALISPSVILPVGSSTVTLTSSTSNDVGISASFPTSSLGTSSSLTHSLSATSFGSSSSIIVPFPSLESGTMVLSIPGTDVTRVAAPQATQPPADDEQASPLNVLGASQSTDRSPAEIGSDPSISMTTELITITETMTESSSTLTTTTVISTVVPVTEPFVTLSVPITNSGGSTITVLTSVVPGPASSHASPHSSLLKKNIIGGVIGGIVGVLVIAILVTILLCRRKQRWNQRAALVAKAQHPDPMDFLSVGVNGSASINRVPSRPDTDSFVLPLHLNSMGIDRSSRSPGFVVDWELPRDSITDDPFKDPELLAVSGDDLQKSEAISTWLGDYSSSQGSDSSKFIISAFPSHTNFNNRLSADSDLSTFSYDSFGNKISCGLAM